MPSYPSPNGPFFAVESRGAIWVFRTRSDAENWLEAIDVKNDEYRFFAANGAEIRLTVVGSSLERVVVTNEVLGLFPDELEGNSGATSALCRRRDDF